MICVHKVFWLLKLQLFFFDFVFIYIQSQTIQFYPTHTHTHTKKKIVQRLISPFNINNHFATVISTSVGILDAAKCLYVSQL